MDQNRAERSASWRCSEAIIGAMIEVHRHLGPGLLESTYEACICQELDERGLRFERQLAVPLIYKGTPLGVSYRLDLVVEGHVLVELKTVDTLLPVHVAQVITYLRLTDLPIGLLVNFNVPVLKQGLRRLWRSPTDAPPEQDP
jgi:GxxExxY protein